MHQSTADLSALLRVEKLDKLLFRANNGPGSHVFGGQVMGQALSAACATTPAEVNIHSMHGYFLRPGDYKKPIVFEVDPIRDGRSFVTRRVVATQHGRAIFNLSASFAKTEPGLEHHRTMPTVKPPESLQSEQQYYQDLAKQDPKFERFAMRFEAIDSRQAEGIHNYNDVLYPDAKKNTWIRFKGDMEEDFATHASMLAYMSDMDFLSVAMLPFGRPLGRARFQAASLDHAIWFHRPFKANDWLLFNKQSPNSGQGRGFVRGQIFNTQGVLVASIAQECLMREIKK